MGITDTIGKWFVGDKQEDVSNIEGLLDEIEQEEIQKKNPPADFYVKSITLEDENVVQSIYSELEDRNIVILKMTPLIRQQARLKKVLDQLKAHVSKLNGDIAAIDEQRLLITPAKVKIVKARK